MNKKEGFAMSGMAILGICLLVIGLLIIGYGGVSYGFGLSLDFQSFLVGGLTVALIGAGLIPGLPAAAKLTVLALAALAGLLYIHSMPDDFELMMKLIADVVVLGLAAWLATIFLRK
ncbi:hypothetical protein STRDD11_00943 [Streptococcus sp. DD11]|uniref:hypothetical protein n=1 Tax=Streptococcus sp. DD11 TaxID=1777879 RepID=UPI00079A7DDB|nr:hypothetical protein [Streptococcus sp. DD11]KXT84492.1 hypothetical protein STRDD11_00943 [Streptococcus sp. DD11]